MKLSVPLLLMLAVGLLLVWSGVTDRNPMAVIRAIFTGQSIPESGVVTKPAPVPPPPPPPR